MRGPEVFAEGDRRQAVPRWGSGEIINDRNSYYPRIADRGYGRHGHRRAPAGGAFHAHRGRRTTSGDAGAGRAVSDTDLMSVTPGAAHGPLRVGRRGVDRECGRADARPQTLGPLISQAAWGVAMPATSSLAVRLRDWAGLTPVDGRQDLAAPPRWRRLLDAVDPDGAQRPEATDRTACPRRMKHSELMAEGGGAVQRPCCARC